MKARAIVLSGAMLCLCCSVHAADNEPAPFKKTFSIEIGYGIQPLHATFSPLPSEEDAMAKNGQAFVNNSDSFYLPVDISEVWRVSPHWELGLTESICWKFMDVVQYGTFGTDPNGNPRYDLDNRTTIGRKAALPSAALSFQARVIWSPKWKVTAYSGLCVGFTSMTGFIPVPGITPAGVRYGGKHIYFFAEATLSPIATIAHGGLGWRF
ncbi:MAG: hypothetical protein J5640_06785 [Bacteroidales bacterium]|nr:hypothetical protein [Bacteroidales bacterium]